MQVLITGPWGSGTTCMAQCLNAAGLKFPEPHFKIADPRNPNSFEQVHFRDAILTAVNESSLKVVNEKKELMNTRLIGCRTQFTSFSDYGIKLPAAAFVLSEIESVFQSSLQLVIAMDRNTNEIQTTCRRRGWPDFFGTAGATAIRKQLAVGLPMLSTPVMQIDFSVLRSRSSEVLAHINGCISANLDIDTGASVIRPPK